MQTNQSPMTTEQLIFDAKAWLQFAINNNNRLREEERQRGRKLAQTLREVAIDLAYSKATEFSSDIPEFQLTAAKIALLTFDASSAERQRHEHDIVYYKSFSGTQWIVNEYENFKREFTT